MKTMRKQTGLAAALAIAAALGIGCDGNGVDTNAAERQRLAAVAADQAEHMRQASMRVQALDVELQRLDQSIEAMERSHATNVNQVRLQSQKIAAELAALKLSMGVATPAVAAAPEVPDEAGTALVGPAEPVAPGAVKVTPTAAARPYGFMAKLFFLIILVLAVGLIFHVVMSRVQEEEDDEGDDRQFRTEEGTISLSPRAQREMGEGAEERKDPYT